MNPGSPDCRASALLCPVAFQRMGLADLRLRPPAIPAHPPQISISSVLLQIPTVFLMTFLEALETGYGKYKNPYHNQIDPACSFLRMRSLFFMNQVFLHHFGTPLVSHMSLQENVQILPSSALLCYAFPSLTLPTILPQSSFSGSSPYTQTVITIMSGNGLVWWEKHRAGC